MLFRSPPPPKEQPTGASVGEMYGLHPKYGKFVRLNGKETPAVGDMLVALRKGKVVATLSVEYDGPQGLALCGRHLAYVESQSQIVWTNWRTGASRAVFRTDHSFLYTVRRAGCR